MSTAGPGGSEFHVEDPREGTFKLARQQDDGPGFVRFAVRETKPDATLVYSIAEYDAATKHVKGSVEGKAAFRDEHESDILVSFDIYGDR